MGCTNSAEASAELSTEVHDAVTSAELLLGRSAVRKGTTFEAT
jgi:hypothetical protein